MKRVIIIEDEKEIAESMTDYLKLHGFQVSAYNSAENFYESFRPNFKGLYLVDWNLPGDSGLDIIRQIRSRDKVSPIFIVSAYSGASEIVEGLKSGADDYITKPFNYEELLTRSDNALVKFTSINEQLLTEGIKLLDEAHSIIKDGQTVNLTAREYIIFKFLYQKANEPVSREDLIGQFNNEEMTSRNIDVHVFSLRKKIKNVDLPIETVWGTGYKLPLQTA